MDELFLELQTALAGEYSIERELGRGGMGVVYLAREVRLAREVAIKVLPPDLAASRERREQFLREAQTAARLSHPNIVPIYRVDEAGGFVYFVMAFVNGETLADRVRNRGPLAPHQAGRILREVAWALTYAHSTGIIHRDIKAENILLERGTDRAIVTDFGIAAVAHADARGTDGTIAGSAHYASPEQIAGQPAEPASDIYSLGVTGFLALTGRLPFDAPTSREVLSMHLTSRAPSVVSYAATTPTKLAHVIERCLAKRPEHRFASALAFAEAVEQSVEPPRDIPAPLRLWLNETNRLQRPLLQIVGSTVLTGAAAIPLAAATGSLLVGTAVTLSIFFAVGFLPSVVRMNRVIAAGYGIDDVRVAIRDYWALKREEMLFELASPSHTLATSTVTLIFGGSFLSAAALTGLASSYHVAGLPIAAAIAWATALASGILALRDRSRLRSISTLGQGQTKFYGSKWGERFVRFCSLGVKKRLPSASLPQLTEVALGRATDALFDALPKAVRKQLKPLPATVRRLEADAKKLREEIDKLDTSIAQLDGDARALSGDDGEIRGQRDRLRADLRSLRERANERLAATVAALENIRLDLLRLQLGDGQVSSVTASLEAAQLVASDLQAFADASRDVERDLTAHHSGELDAS
jgi:serine/threonine-protein kinase